jgi:hypothetical protein
MRKYLAKTIIAFVTWISSTLVCEGQYVTGVGVRFGKFASGIDVKHFFNTEKQLGMEVYSGYTLEANGGYFAKAFIIKQTNINKADIPFPLRAIFKQSRLQIPLKFFYGGGIHTGYFEKRYYTIKHGDIFIYGDQIMNFGVDATCGLEYSTRKLPLAVSLDVTPFYTFYNPGPEWLDFGVNVRYVFR